MLNTIWKTFFVAAGLLVCCAPISGCGGDNGPAEKPATFAPRPPAESSPEGGGRNIAPGPKDISETTAEG